MISARAGRPRQHPWLEKRARPAAGSRYAAPQASRPLEQRPLGEIPMTPDQVLDEFRAAGALLEGHFILSSGLHSPVFFQKNAVFMDPARTERLCKALAEKAH